MKELKIEDLTLISGGVNACNHVGVVGIYGAIPAGHTVGQTLAFQAGLEGATAIKASRLGGYVGLSFSAGYVVGSCLYHETPFGDWASNKLYEATGLNKNVNDQSGNDYGNTTNKDGNAYGG